VNETLLSILVCPRCGGGFRWEPAGPAPGWGVLACRRHRYPVLEEIPVLRAGGSAEAAIEAIERGDPAGALGATLGAAPGARADRLLGGLGAYLLRGSTFSPLAAARMGARLHGDSAPASFRAQNRVLLGRGPRGSPSAAEGFALERSDPSFVVAEGLAGALLPREKAVLDLACGVGHLAASLGELAEGRLVAGLDALFPALLLARRFVSPHAALVCADAGAPLPFRDGSFGMVICAGGFLDLPFLPAAAREVARVLSARDGVACLTHLPGPASAAPALSPEYYLEALAPLAVSFVDEREALASLVGSGRRAASPVADPAELRASLRLVAVGGSAPPREIAIEGPVLPVAVGPIVWNPLYEKSSVDAAEGMRVLARSSFRYPSETEAGPLPGLLPESVRLPLALENPAYAAETAPELLSSLLAQRVALTLPAGMAEAGGPSQRGGGGSTRQRRSLS